MQAEPLLRFPDCDSLFAPPDQKIATCTKYLEQVSPANSEDYEDIARAYFVRARAYEYKQDFDRAIAGYSEVIRRKFAEAGYLEARAGVYMKKGEYTNAVADYSKMISRSPWNHHAYRGRAKAWAALGETVSAEEDERKADEVRAQQLNKPVAVLEARIPSCSPNEFGPNWQAYWGPSLQIDHCTKALALPQATVQQKAKAYRIRGLAYLEKDGVDAAIADFDEGIRLDPKSAALYGHRGNAYQLKKDYGRAIADYNRAIALFPEDGPAFFSGRACCTSLGMLAALYGNPAIYSDRAWAYLAQGDTERADADRRKADELSNKLFAEMRIVQCASEEKIAICTEALAMPQLIDRQRAYAYQHRGAAYTKKGDVNQAMADFAEAIRLAPESGYTYFLRAYAHRVNRDLDRAIADLDEAIRLDPKSADFYNDRAAFYIIVKKDYGRGIADYNQAIALNPDNNPEYYRNRAAAYRTQGDTERAAADDRKAREVRSRPESGLANLLGPAGR